MSPTSDPSIQPYLAAAHLFRDGARILTFEQFRTALGASLCVHGVSPRGVYNRFRDDPAGFIASRVPQTDAEELITAMLLALEGSSHSVHPISQ